MHNTHLRKESLHGLLVGMACGERIGLIAPNICKRGKRRIARDQHGESWPRFGFFGPDTQLMLMSAQAVLNSCSLRQGFQRAFLRRLCWYQLSIPIGMSSATRWAATIGWLRRIGVPTGCHSTENSPMSRATFVALALNGTGHSLCKWIETSTILSHNHPITVEACFLLGTLARIAANAKTKPLDPAEALGNLAELAGQVSMKEKLQLLQEQIGKRRSPRTVARTLGWKNSIPKNSEATLLMACYCFLRYPKDYYRAVNSVRLIGGDRSTLCALVGGLVGAHLGFQSLPDKIRQSSFPYPHGLNWMADLSERLSHWPHGSEDLNWAPSLRSWPLLQLVRNLLHHIWRLVSSLFLWPWKALL